MHLIDLALPLALAGSALANPLLARGGWGGSCTADSCLAAVTGKAALGDDGLRGQHCASFLATTVTPPAVTVTATITGTDDQGWNTWKRAVTVCPNEVPNYASACATDAYSSACSCFGFTQLTTTTLAPTTTTKTVYVAPTGSAGWGSSCTVATTTVTVTASATTTKAGFCLTSETAAAIVKQFGDYLTNPTAVLQNTNNELGLLAPDFTDTSDSINFMAEIPLGSVTFNSTIAFQYGQGTQEAVASVTTLNLWFSCNSITWRWSLLPFPGALPVTGINYMIINDKGQLETNYAEFDNGAWLLDIGNPQCNTTASAGGAKRSIKSY